MDEPQLGDAGNAQPPPGWSGKGYVSPYSAALLRRCPRCGKGPLVAGYLRMREACPHCRLSFAFADAGDGPAVFVMLIVGFIVCGLALWLEVKISPPFWVHAVLWVPLITVLAATLLPMLKALLVALQYRNKAALGRLDLP
jgi:uncharacterized protein (DUF983 family)